MTTATTTAEPQPPLTLLQRRAQAAARVMGCTVPPAYLSQLTRAELFAVIDSAETGSTP